MVKLDRKEWKKQYFVRVKKFVEEYSKCLVVGVDNVRSKQMQQVRQELRGKAELLMGKNTLLRRCLRDLAEEMPHLNDLLPHVVGNIGFCFTDMDVNECVEILVANKVQAPAKAGIVAPLDVFIEAGPTGQGPEKTSFFQALNLPTKIAKGSIELLNRVHLIPKGEKVGLSEARLLNMLNISPFFYGISLVMIMDGNSVYPPAVLEIKPETLLAKVMVGISEIAAVSLELGIPTKASVPHSIVNGAKNIIAAALELDLSFPKEHPGLECAKLYTSDPDAWAAKYGGSGGGGSGGTESAPAADNKPAAAAPPPAAEEESEEDMMSMFD